MASDKKSAQLKSDALMEQMKLHLTTDAGKALTKKIGLVYQLNIAPKKLGFNEESYVVDLKKGEVKKGTYEDGKPDATFSFTDDDFIKIASGKMNPQIAFMRGAMKIKGSISAAQKFTPDIFPKPAKMWWDLWLVNADDKLGSYILLPQCFKLLLFSIEFLQACGRKQKLVQSLGQCLLQKACSLLCNLVQFPLEFEIENLWHLSCECHYYMLRGLVFTSIWRK